MPASVIPFTSLIDRLIVVSNTIGLSGGSRGRGRPLPIDLTNFCINVKSNPRMHQTHHFRVKIHFFLGRGHSPLPRSLHLDRPPPPHYEILGPLLIVRKGLGHVFHLKTAAIVSRVRFLRARMGTTFPILFLWWARSAHTSTSLYILDGVKNPASGAK